MNTPDPCDEVVAQLVAEMRRVQSAHANVSAAILSFVIIDAMAHIGRATSVSKATGEDFKAWVDRYMRSQKPAEYRYSGNDLWAARCDLLHTFSNQFRTSKKKLCLPRWFTSSLPTRDRFKPCGIKR